MFLLSYSWWLVSAFPEHMGGRNNAARRPCLGGEASHLTAPAMRAVGNNLTIGRTLEIEEDAEEEEGMYSRLSNGGHQHGIPTLRDRYFPYERRLELTIAKKGFLNNDQ